MKLTGGRGVDAAIEAVGVPASFITCEDIVAPGGTIASVGVHGVKVDLHLERLWDRNITITTRLVDTVTTPMLLKTVQSFSVQSVERPSNILYLTCRGRLSRGILFPRIPRSRSGNLHGQAPTVSRRQTPQLRSRLSPY